MSDVEDVTGMISSSELRQLQTQQRKRRKVVDRKASKGRKIRYEVHDKLVNFMTPHFEKYDEERAKRIFATLFGQRRGASSEV
mmetsp:Transcript_10445/g.27365  ORF Transcript_10445/g.27365 Transcript_10445/m.27365 type:complete len:83 (-) Transcript_10445:47-295(-)